MSDSINWCDLKKNAKHIGEVSTSRVDGSPSGAEIYTSTNEVTGQSRDTLAGKFKKITDENNVFIAGWEKKLEGIFSGNIVSYVSGSRMREITDANGNINTMISIPCFTFDDIGMGNLLGTGTHPAFLKKDGTLIPEILVAAYPASSKDYHVVVKGGLNPWVNVDFDTAKSKCAEMGAGWHLMTAMQWSAVALWCLANSFQPRGNTQYGRSHEKNFEVALRTDGLIPNDRTGTGVTKTGSGSDNWRHDASPFGISGLVGNTWEWIDGVKLNENRIIISYDSIDTENNWYDTNIWITATDAQPWSTATLSGTNEKLKQILLEPIDQTKALKGKLYFTSNGERMCVKGGAANSSDGAGLAALQFYYKRKEKAQNLGFRPVFIGV